MVQQTLDDRTIADVARRHDVGTDAVETLVSALRRGGGTQAQFSHVDLGGMGQWSRGGMIMVGDMFNQSLKAKVDRLCNELSDMLTGSDSGGDTADRDAPKPDVAEREPASRRQGTAAGGDADHWAAQSPAGGRWPASLGRPSATGSQNDMHYAVFPDTRRLAIERSGKVTVYDTGDHRIGGLSQQQGGGQSISLASQHGLVALDELPVVDRPGTDGD